MYKETERRRYINKNSAHLSENDFLLPSGNLRHTFTLSLRASSISYFSWYFFYHLITYKVEISARSNIAVKKRIVLGFRKTWPSTGHVNLISNSHTKSRCFQHIKWDVCIGYRVQKSKASPWEDTDIFQHIVKSWTANWMTLVCFSNTASRWMNSRRRKYGESEAIVCLSATVLEESIVTIASVGSLSQSICRRRERGESDAINLQPQRREREGWSRIELRILDSRVPQKASIRARTDSVRISTDASLGCGEHRRVDYSSCLPHSTTRGGVHGHGGETCCRELSEDRQSVNW